MRVGMKFSHALLGVALCSAAGLAEARTVPLRNPALLNIGYVCKWHAGCMKRQQRAMKRALSYVARAEPPAWKIRLCNRNASRKGTRVDWVGYNNCIRNKTLRSR